MNGLTELLVQAGIPTALGLVSIGLAWTKKRLNLQENSTAATLQNVANIAIQQATANFAGRVAGGLMDGSLSTGTAVVQLQSYLNATVADSVKLLQPSSTALTTMLLGKVADVAGVPVPAAVSGADPVVRMTGGVLTMPVPVAPVGS